VKELLARRNLLEMDELEQLIEMLGTNARVQVVDTARLKDREFPLYVIEIGSKHKEDPVVGFFGGVHGLEKIGSEVILAYMRTVIELLKWDQGFKDRLQHSRLVFMPIINPVGITLRSRANGNGVDLMRNSPLDAEEGGGPIYRGHRISKHLPWYRGAEGAPMELESQALCKVVEEYLFPSKISVAVDVHSGFGARDRFWFPYGYSRKPFEYMPEVYALKELFESTYPHHFYVIEPVSRQYTINGDLWDHMFLRHRKEAPDHRFFSWTLEMGSWLWLRKNPAQIFSRAGLFNPMIPHRRQRILRRHNNLFDFLHRAVMSPDAWLHLADPLREKKRQAGMKLWYEG
jgi:hypothetical protein